MANTYTALSTVTVGSGGAASILFSSIPNTYTDLCIVMSARSTAGSISTGMQITLSGSTADRSYQQLYGTGTTVTASTGSDNYCGEVNGNTSTANTFSNNTIYLPSYSSSNRKPYSVDYFSENNGTNAFIGAVAGFWNDSSIITSIEFYLSAGNFAEHSTATLYAIYRSEVTTAPATPTGVTATAFNGSAQVDFTASTGATIYTVTSTPSSVTQTVGQSPVVFTGLTNGTPYTFTVTASNPFGTSAGATSGSVTPSAGTPYDVLVGTDNSPYINAWIFNNGFTTKYTNPSTLPTQTAAAVSFAPNKTALVIGEDGSSPYVSAYAWSSGFGSKFSNPATAPANRRLGADFRSGSNAVGFGGDSPSPWVDAYPWSSGFGSKYSNPTVGTGGFSVRWSPNGAVFSSSNNSTTPYLAAWAWSSGFGSKYSNPSSLPGGGTYGQAWTPSGNAIVYSVGASPFFAAYPWSGGYGTKYADPATLPTNLPGRVLNFNPAGNVLVGAISTTSSTSPKILAYAWSSGFGTKYADPATFGSTSGENAYFTPDGNAVIQSNSGGTPNAWVWNSGFGAKYPDPATTITGSGYGLDVK